MGDHFMGDEFTAPRCRSKTWWYNKVIYQTSSKSATAEIIDEDRAPQKGLNFYYVRAVQKHRMAAWSSPNRVNVK